MDPVKEIVIQAKTFLPFEKSYHRKRDLMEIKMSTIPHSREKMTWAMLISEEICIISSDRLKEPTSF